MEEAEIHRAAKHGNKGWKGKVRKGLGGRRGTSRGSALAKPGDFIGIVCLEDLIEVLIQEDIWDESDRHGMGRGPAVPRNVPELQLQSSVDGRAARTVSETEYRESRAGGDSGEDAEETRSMMRCGSGTSLLP